MNRDNKTKLIILYIILALSLATMAFFGVYLIIEMQTTRQGQAFYDSISVEFKPRLTPAAQAPIPLEVEESFTPFIDFVAKQENFPDIVAWIQSEGTTINYPIVQGDDNDFYLHHLPDKSRHRMGSVFMDYRNSPNFLDRATIIYGHDMASGDIFGSLRHYASQSYFEQHSSMFIFTPYSNYQLLLFGGYILDSAYEIPPMHFSGADDFYSYIADIRRRSIFTSYVEVSYGDRIVFLATCVADGAISDRLIIAGILLEI